MERKEATNVTGDSPPPRTMTTPLEHGDLAHLLPASWKTQVTGWLAEDTPSFDYGGFVVGDGPRTATLWCKSPGVLAGAPFFDEVFAQCGCAVTWQVRDGAELPAGRTACAVVSGPTRGILLGERVALNILARCSGVATRSHAAVSSLRAAGFAGRVAGTRKTTPGFRLVEKYGILVGGADAHRMDLSAMVMLKDNHVWSRGSIRDAVAAAKSVAGFALKVEVEVQTEEEADEAIGAGADVVMLDNFTGDGVKAAARSLKERWKGKREFLLEVSGGLTTENVGAYLSNGELSYCSVRGCRLGSADGTGRRRHHLDEFDTPGGAPCRLFAENRPIKKPARGRPFEHQPMLHAGGVSSSRELRQPAGREIRIGRRNRSRRIHRPTSLNSGNEGLPVARAA